MTSDPERAVGAKKKIPWLLEFRSSNGFILATVCLAIGTVVPVLPFSLRERSNVPEDQVQWWNSFIFAVFGAAILIGSPICGWAADRTSNRSVTFYTGLLILAGATILFGLAKASWVLLISRLLQGLSAAITYTVGLALLVDTVGRDNIGQWMGTALSSSSFGLIVSPLLGGIVYAKAGYMAVFGMAMGLIIFDIVMRLIMIEKKTAAKYTDVKDMAPANGFYGTFTTEQEVRNEQTNNATPPTESQDVPSDGQKDPQRKKGRMPTILVLLGMPRLLAAIYGIFVNVSILAAFDGVLPLYVKRLFGWNSLNAGLMFLCLAIPALTGPLVGKLSDRAGPRWIAVAGCALSAPPLVLLRLVAHDSMEQKILLCALLVCCGFSLILIVSPVAADLSAVVEEKEKADPDAFGPGGAYAQAFALFNCSMAAATLFGPVVAGALVEQYGWGVMSAAMGIFAFSGAIPAVGLSRSFFYTGGWIFAKKT
ncbi:MAG: hypothetical protein LQ350_003126 [Teloschistes chrysophthalmus]|nr:MAG: hypothetical protein LQ350_003126 [Niorma chrysophthalma]